MEQSQTPPKASENPSPPSRSRSASPKRPTHPSWEPCLKAGVAAVVVCAQTFDATCDNIRLVEYDLIIEPAENMIGNSGILLPILRRRELTEAELSKHFVLLFDLNIDTNHQIWEATRLRKLQPSALPTLLETGIITVGVFQFYDQMVGEGYQVSVKGLRCEYIRPGQLQFWADEVVILEEDVNSVV